jgi:hypothetical protein
MNFLLSITCMLLLWIKISYCRCRKCYVVLSTITKSVEIQLALIVVIKLLKSITTNMATVRYLEFKSCKLNRKYLYLSKNILHNIQYSLVTITTFCAILKNATNNKKY